VVACSSISSVIIRDAEKVKSTKYYAKYKAYVDKKRKATEFWAKYQTYAKVAKAYAKIAFKTFTILLFLLSLLSPPHSVFPCTVLT
jgi:hypothetical protein